jgi:hypothetical protein
VIKIQVNKQTLYLEPKTTLRFDLISNLFDDDVIPLSVVYPFNIPAPPNQSIFEFANFVEISRSVKSYSCDFYFAGYLLFAGTLYVTSYSNEYYRCSIVVNSFSEGFADKLLSEFDYGGDINIGGNPHAATNVAFHAEQIVKGLIQANYTFPLIYAPEFYGSVDDNNVSEYNEDWGGDAGAGDVGKYLNNYSRTGNTFPVNQVREDPECDNVYAMLPCAYLHYVLERVFYSEKYNLYGDFMTDEELQQLILFNNRPLDEKYTKYYVQASMTSQQVISLPTKILFADDSTGENEDDDNCYDAATSIYTAAYAGYHEVKLSIKAKAVINDVDGNFALMKVASFPPGAGIVMDEVTYTLYDYSTWYDIEISLKAYFDIGEEFYIYCNFQAGGIQSSATVKDGVIKVSHNSYCNLNQFSNILNLQNHMPPVTAGNLFNNLVKTFGLAVFVDTITKEIELAFKKDVISDNRYIDLTECLIAKTTEIEPSETDGVSFILNFADEFADYSDYTLLGHYPTFNDLPTPKELNQVAIVDCLNVAFIWKKDADTNTTSWLYFADVQYEQTIGDGSTEIEPDISTLTIHQGTDFICPQYKDTGSSPAFETGINDVDPILLFYRGMKEDDNANDYPFASCTKYDNNGSSAGNYEMISEAIFEEFLEPWHEWLIESETVSMKLDCNISHIIEIIKLFAPSKTATARKVRVKSLNYIPKKFSFMLSMNGVKETEAILVK